MKIMLVTEAFGPKGFGVGQVISRLIKLYHENGIALKILSPVVEDSENLLTAQEFVGVPYREKKSLWHPSQRKFFRTEMETFRPDLIHVHGLFTFIQRSAVQAAIDANIPVLISPHGMLAPWLWRQHNNGYALIKKIYWKSWMKPVLQEADCFHAITKIEAGCIQHEFPNSSQVLIPNAIDLDQTEVFSENQAQEKNFVFLGRLHPIKGVDLLIRAFQQARLENDWRLVIAGPDFSLAYGQELRQLVKALGLAGRVDFIGPVYGKEKYALLAKAWTVVVPSYSEVVALVNLEAAAVQTPTITTTGTGLHDWAESGGFLIDATVESLTQALKNVASWTLTERQSRGAQARAFVQARYSWQAIGPRWANVYQQIAQRNF
jgi:glycosyltransferase involved in cell wall biosynthesis